MTVMTQMTQIPEHTGVVVLDSRRRGDAREGKR
jgi:hypothetical protein